MNKLYDTKKDLRDWADKKNRDVKNKVRNLKDMLDDVESMSMTITELQFYQDNPEIDDTGNAFSEQKEYIKMKKEMKEDLIEKIKSI